MQFMSAGPKSELVDMSLYTAGSSPSIFGILGTATKGVVNEAVLCTSPIDFVSKFGEPKKGCYSALAAIETLKQANMVYYIRVADASLAKSAVTIRLEGDVGLTFEAKTAGTWAKSRLAVEVKNSVGKDFNLYVLYDGSVVESYECSMDGTSSKYVVVALDNSEYITVVDNQDGEGASAPAVGVHLLTGGNDGMDSLVDSDYIGQAGKNTGMEIFKLAHIDVDVLACPGCSAEVASALVSIAEYRGDCEVVIDTPNELNSSQVLEWSNGVGSFADNPTFNSMHGAIYWPWFTGYLDTYNKVKYDVPPSVYVLGQYALTDREYNYWWPPAGLKRGRIARANGVKHICDTGTMDSLYGGSNVINPIAHFPADGIVIWGQRTTQRTMSATNRINVARLIFKVRKAIMNTTRSLTFDLNDEATWDLWKGAVEPFLSDIKASRGLYDYHIVMDATTVTPAHIDRLEMPGKVFLQPVKAAEFIPISFIITPTGVTFE